MSTEEYNHWLEDHKENCSANHKGSSGKMEVDVVVEMFRRSLSTFAVRYKNYIGDGDSKTYSGILKAEPYGNIEVGKKKCIGHVQKRRDSRVRECVNKTTQTVDKSNKKIQKKYLVEKVNSLV